MSSHPRIGLSLRIVDAEGYEEPRDAISHDWVRTLDGWDMIPVLIPNALTDPGAYLRAAGLDLLVLTGGDDIGATPLRDETETSLYRTALEGGIPVLGVCRGLQLIATLSGGETERVDGHTATRHPVAIGRALEPVYGSRIDVNSFHALGVRASSVGNGLAVGATDSSGMVEAIVHRERPVAAVMWHPERAGAPDGDRKLIERLVEHGAFWLNAPGRIGAAAGIGRAE